jgi:hypothetical protein
VGRRFTIPLVLSLDSARHAMCIAWLLIYCLRFEPESLDILKIRLQIFLTPCDL